jgi:Family of unknown function (DUF6220)
MREKLALPYLVFAVLFLLAVLGQALLAGLALFWRDSVWSVHAGLGHMAPLFPFVMLILALVGGMGSRLRPYTGLLLAGVLVQTEVFAGLRSVTGLGSAYHPVLAVLLFWGGTVLAQRSLALARAHRRAEARVESTTSVTCTPCDPMASLDCA